MIFMPSDSPMYFQAEVKDGKVIVRTRTKMGNYGEVIMTPEEILSLAIQLKVLAFEAVELTYEDLEESQE